MVAFTERLANAIRITALSPAALALRLEPGLTLADARARVPDLIAIARDPTAEAALLARIVAGLARYGPMASASPPDGALIDISGCTHPYGDETGLADDLAARLARGGVTARLGRGATPESARARARHGIDDLHALPVAALEAGVEAETALRRAGLKTIGDLACRPRGPLAARFGDVPLRLARLLEEEDRRIAPERPPPPIAALRRFAEPIARVEDALAALEALLAEAAVMLGERHQGGRRFEARFFRSDGAVLALAIETGRPTRDPAATMRLFRERLDAMRDPLDPGFGFDLIRLDIPYAEPLAPRQPGFTEDSDPIEDVAALVDRLAARMGRRRIRRARPRDTHIPEQAAGACTDPAPWPAPPPDEPPLRPLMLVDPPQPVAATFAVPDGPPRAFAWRGRHYRLARVEGPERIAPEWWKGATAARDYYRVEDEAGHRFWLFRRDEGADWYLHGLFA